MMRLISSTLFALLAVTSLTDALPFTPLPRSNQPLARRKATYSVVPVDGGSTSAAAPTTVVESATLPPVTETQLATLLSTIVVTAFETPTTIVVTVTETPSPPPSTIESTPAPGSTPAPSYSEYQPTTTTVTSAVTDCTTSTTTTTSAYTELTTMTSIMTPSAVVSVTTLPPQIITVTALPSSTPYDDGMWHTTYFHHVYEATVSSSSSSYTPTTSYYSYPSVVLSSSMAVPTLDTNIGIPANGTWTALGLRGVVVRTPPSAIAKATYSITPYHPSLEKV